MFGCGAKGLGCCVRVSRKKVSMAAFGGGGGGFGDTDRGGSLVDTSLLGEVLAVDRPLEATARAFAETYQPHERFRVNCALCVMLQVRGTTTTTTTTDPPPPFCFFFFLRKPNHPLLYLSAPTKGKKNN